MYRRLLVITFVVIMLHVEVFAAEVKLLSGETLPELHDLNVHANVSYETKSGIYVYTYSVSNPSKNTGAIKDIDVDITKPEGSISLSQEGLSNGRGYLRHSSEHIYATSTVPLIPIGISAPDNWVTGLTVNGTATWGAAEETNLIYPASSMYGFEMNSKGLPGIRQFTISPYFKQTPVLEATKADVERIRAIEEEITFKGKTIGPTAPPADFKPLDFLNYIINTKHEATSLGWIKDKGIEQSLDAKLDNAKKKIEEGNNTAAKNILEAFVNEVEAQKDKHLTSEAYGLLKYNVQYLMEKL